MWVGEGTQIEPGVRIEAPVLIGAGCLVESEAELIGPLIVGDGCVIERGAVLEGMINWDGVKTGRGSRLAGSILGRHVVVHHEAVVHEDAVIGDRTDVAPHASWRPGARFEPRSCVGADGSGRDLGAHLRRRGSHCERHRRRPARPRLPQALRAVRSGRRLALRAVRRRPPPSAGAALPALRRSRPVGGARPAPRRRAPLPRVRRPRPLVPLRRGRLHLRGAGPGARHGLQVPRPALARRRHGGRGPSPAFAGRGRASTLVTWVPGHRDHQLERGFNQAELLARGFARRAGLPYAPLLRRVRHGARQSGLDRAGRAANVRDAFALREDANGVLRKLKRVMIVDDVYTTGETLDHCAEVLARAGLEPHVFTFARTVRATPSQASLDHAVQKERCP